MEANNKNTTTNTWTDPKKEEESSTQVFDNWNYLINMYDTQTKLLGKQTNIINTTGNQLHSQKSELEKLTDTMHTRRRLMIYDEKDDRFNRRVVQVLKFTVFTLSLVIATLVYKKRPQ